MNIPQRQFSNEEVNRCYLRWQHLRNEHGMNAPSVPEFIYLTKVLQFAAKQRQELQMQRQQQGISGSQQNIVPNSSDQAELPNNASSHISASASPHLAPNMQLNGNETFSTSAHQSPIMQTQMPLNSNGGNNMLPQRQSSVGSLNATNFSPTPANNGENAAEKPDNPNHNNLNLNNSCLLYTSRCV